ncbi:phage major capsid protein [Oculatella sp. FACHB-28]|uniref:phage major capsid protein n=1 Tax=Oculatella sp. FACHB-28 TaxID=2692845 RepID=UPI0016846386|nr:phage major capsid protein [Oculatella sp. FACHB-28]MBD2060502.1 phage major capsid protein [Oculatella sp. FACHB-28]
MSLLTPQGSLSIQIDAKLTELDVLNMPMLQRLPKFRTAQKSLNWNVNVAGAGATGEAVTADVSTYSSDQIRPAALPIGVHRVRSSFQIPRGFMAQAAAHGEGELRNLLALHLKGASREIMQTVAGAIYSGTGAAANGGIVGLGAIHATAVLDNKSVDAYAGIDPDDAGNALWTNYINPLDGEFTPDVMFETAEEILEGTVTGTKGNYTAIYCRPSTATKYKKLFAAEASIQTAPYGVADLGFSSLSFEGRPVIQDPYCPAGLMYFVNESEISLYSFADQVTLQAETVPDQIVTIYLVPMPSTNPEMVNFAAYLKPQLKIERRSAVAVITGIA